MNFLINESRVNLSIGDAGLIALLGYLVVFFGLVLLMCLIIIIGKYMVKRRAKKEIAQKETSIPTAEDTKLVTFEETPGPEAPGAAGELKLHDVDPRTAAILMAIVADKMNRPINELRFISIREVK